MIIYPHDPRYKFDIRQNQPTDAVVIREIWCENVYEVFDGDLSDTKIVVDVGANIGAFSIFMHSLDPEVLVYAVEPQEMNLANLKNNIEMNRLEKNIIPVEVGISNYKGTAFISDEGGGSKLVDDPGTQLIEVQTLNDLWKALDLEFVDVLKIDIEGAECDAILGCDDKLLNLCRYIVVEFDNHAKDGDFGRIVTKLALTHQLKIVGSEATGGYIFAHRY